MAKLIVEIEVFTYIVEADWDVRCNCCYDIIESGKQYHKAVMMVNKEKFREIKLVMCDFCKKALGW